MLFWNPYISPVLQRGSLGSQLRQVLDSYKDGSWAEKLSLTTGTGGQQTVCGELARPSQKNARDRGLAKSGLMLRQEGHQQPAVTM